VKSMKIDNDLDSQKKLVVGLFWTGRKTIRSEGCAPFRIKKISTASNTHLPEGRKLLKLSDEILDDILDSMQKNEAVKFELSMGNENIELMIKEDTFSVSSTKTPDLEDEIIEKMEQEMQRTTPNFCQTFLPKIFPQDSTKI
jgi:hypothetical protein